VWNVAVGCRKQGAVEVHVLTAENISIKALQEKYELTSADIQAGVLWGLTKDE
jgi:hypothetical protein